MDSAGQFQTQSNAILSTSYAVFQVAMAKKPHNIAETLIKSCIVECASILLGKSAKSKIKKKSLYPITLLNLVLLIRPVISNQNS